MNWECIVIFPFKIAKDVHSGEGNFTWKGSQYALFQGTSHCLLGVCVSVSLLLAMVLQRHMVVLTGAGKHLNRWV